MAIWSVALGNTNNYKANRQIFTTIDGSNVDNSFEDFCSMFLSKMVHRLKKKEYEFFIHL